MASILVTGGNGFIPSHIVDALIGSAGHDVAVLDPRPRRFDALPSRARWLRASFADEAAVVAALQSTRYDVVYHAALHTAHTDAEERALNVEPTARLIRACAAAGVRRIVFLSSAAVYGPPQADPVAESAPLRPIGPLGVAKAEIERLLAHSGLEHVCLRVSAPFGPRQDPTRAKGVVNIFTYKALRGEPVTMRGDGNAMRDFFYIADAAAVWPRAALAAGAAGRAFNIGGPHRLTLNELADAVGRALGAPLGVIRQPMNATEIPRITLDYSAAAAAFGYRPDTPLDAGIRLTARWMREAGLTQPGSRHQ